MAPDTLAALLGFLAFVAPGLAFEMLRERRRPSIEESSFREASRIALSSLVFSSAALLVLALIRTVRPSWFASPSAWLRGGSTYAAAHLGAVVASVAAFLLVAVLLAAGVDHLLRRRAGGHIVTGSIWFSAFRLHRPPGADPWVHLRLDDETEVWGYAGDYTPDQSLDNRELLVKGPQLQYRRKGAVENTLLPDWSFVAVRGATITWMKVQYVAEDEHGATVIVPARYEQQRRRLPGQ